MRFSSIAEYALSRPSSIREIMNLVADFEKHPEKYPRRLIYLGGGWPQDSPPRPVLEAFAELNEKDLKLSARYSPTRGDPDYLEVLRVYERELFGKNLSEDEVISGSGSTDLTSAIFKVFLDPGDEVVLTRPCYLNYTRQLEIEVGGVRIKRWNLIKGDEFEPDLEELNEMITEKTKLILVTTPGNPDSQVMDDETVKAVTEIAAEREAYVVLDEAYRAFHYLAEPRYISGDREENQILLLTLSKELRVPGWRLGHVIADKEVIRALETVEQGRILTPPRLPQRVLVKALQSEERIKEIRRFIRDETPKKYGAVARRTAELMKEISHLRILEPRGGFYVFFDASSVMPSSKEFVSRLLNEWQVALAPGVDFGMEGWIRLSFAPSVEDVSYIEEGVSRIRSFISSIRT